MHEMNMDNVNLTEAATQYLRKGWSVIPVNEKKVPCIPSWTEFQSRLPTEEELKTWFSNPSAVGIALITGKLSNIVVLDVEEEGKAEAQNLQLPQTPLARSGGGGWHAYFKYPSDGNPVPSLVKIENKPFDSRADGGYIILPPSLHKSGNRYSWERSPDVCDFADCPEFLLTMIREWPEKKRKASITPSTSKISTGSRNNTLASLAGSMRAKGYGYDTILVALEAVNLKECSPPLPAAELQNIAKSYSQYEAGSSGIRTPVVVNLEDVEAEDVKWLWTNRIPYGKMTIIEGDPGTGKSSISMDIAASVTLGRNPYGDDERIERKPAKVLLLTAEDGLADTIKPRLESMSADVNLVRSLVAVKDEKGNEQHFSLEKDIAMAEEVLSGGGYGLVIIDPINAYMGAVDTHKDSSVRGILTPLAKLAEKYGVALVCIRHLTKATGGKAMYRGQGSIGFTGAARVVHVVGANPEDFSQRVISCTKNNLAPLPTSLSFKIEGKRVEWTGTVDLGADALLAPALDSDDKSALDEAKEFLEDILSDGPKSQKEVIKEAKKNGIAEKTLRRAKDVLKVKSQKTTTEWRWKMANEPDWTSCPPLPLEPVEAEETKMAKEEVVEKLATLPEDVQPFKRVEWQ